MLSSGSEYLLVGLQESRNNTIHRNTRRPRPLWGFTVAHAIIELNHVSNPTTSPARFLDA